MFCLLERPEDAQVLGFEFYQRGGRASFQRLVHGTSGTMFSYCIFIVPNHFDIRQYTISDNTPI